MAITLKINDSGFTIVGNDEKELYKGEATDGAKWAQQLAQSEVFEALNSGYGIPEGENDLPEGENDLLDEIWDETMEVYGDKYGAPQGCFIETIPGTAERDADGSISVQVRLPALLEIYTDSRLDVRDSNDGGLSIEELHRLRFDSDYVASNGWTKANICYVDRNTFDGDPCYPDCGTYDEARELTLACVNCKSERGDSPIWMQFTFYCTLLDEPAEGGLMCKFDEDDPLGQWAWGDLNGMGQMDVEAKIGYSLENAYEEVRQYPREDADGETWVTQCDFWIS